VAASERTVSPAPAKSDDAVAALMEFARTLPEQTGKPRASGESAPAAGHDGVQSDLLGYVREIDSAQAKAGNTDDADAALRAYVQEIESGGPKIVLAKAEKPKAVTKAAAADDEEATLVGSQVCLRCHAAKAAQFGATLMGKIFRNPRTAQERGGCETCHGPGSLHVKAGGGRGVGGMITFRLDDPRHTPEEYNAVCLSCHEKGDRTLWRGSTHETRGLVCSNCHTIMANVTPKAQLAKLTEMDTCFQCHKNKRAEIWRSSHMPVREGKMTCSTCHNPHGSYSEALLKEATVNDGCYKCHAEKRGPFLWEHAPVRENCLNCHDPHGSINDFLLKISRPRLCQQCHANLTGHPGNPRNPQSVYALNRECQNCHSQHHGSNSPAGSRFIR
jgi:DmsE family decaheme c-type cytochrome